MYTEKVFSCQEDKEVCRQLYSYLLKIYSIGTRTSSLSIVTDILLILTWISTVVQAAPLSQSDSLLRGNLSPTSYVGASAFKGLGRHHNLVDQFQSFNAGQLTEKEKKELLKYLFRYGYIGYVERGHRDSVFVSTEEANKEHLLQDAISVFLTMHNVKSELPGRTSYNHDKGTTSVSLSDILEYSRQPRCSNPDLPDNKIILMDANGTVLKTNNTLLPYSSGEPPAEYFTGSKYTNHNLTWRLMNYSNSNDFNRMRKTLHRAFLTWAKYAPLNFVELPSSKQGPVHHEIYFVEGEHYINSWLPVICSVTMTRNSGDTAHGYFPSFGGTLHINKNRDWEDRYIGDSDKLNLWQTATHEIGHTLGLEHLFWEHGDVMKQIMHPQYHEDIPEGTLGEVDAEAIRGLYGNYPGSSAKEKYAHNEHFALPIPYGHSSPGENKRYVFSFGFRKTERKKNEDKPTRPDPSKFKLNYDIPSDLNDWINAMSSVQPMKKGI